MKNKILTIALIFFLSSMSVVFAKGDHSNVVLLAPSITDGHFVPFTLKKLNLQPNESVTVTDSTGCKLIKIINRTRGVFNAIQGAVSLETSSAMSVFYNDSKTASASVNVTIEKPGIPRSCVNFSNHDGKNYNTKGFGGMRRMKVKQRNGNTVVLMRFQHPMKSNFYISDLSLGTEREGYIHIKMTDASVSKPSFRVSLSDLRKGDLIRLTGIDTAKKRYGGKVKVK